MITYIRDITIQITHVDGEQEFITLEAPNGSDPFRIEAHRLPVRKKYRDRNNKLRRSSDYYFLRFRYEYEHHDMDLRKLLIAEKIHLVAPPNLAGDYQGYQVRLLNESVVKNWYQDLPVASRSQQLIEADTVPSGSVTLEFETLVPVTEDDLLELVWFEGIQGEEPEPEPDPPDAPENFEVTVDHPDADFAWDTVAGVDGYNVYIDSGSGFEKHNETPIETNIYEIDGMDTGEYTAYVKAVEGGVEGDASNEDDFSVYNETQIGAISNLQVWGVADDIDQADESNVNTFPDRQENYDATAMSTPPILLTNHLNGHKVVDFENSDNMTFGSPSFGDSNLMAEESDEFTVYLVALHISSGYAIAKASGGTHATDFVFGLGKLGSNQRYVNLRSERNDYNGATDNTFWIERIKWDGSTPDYKAGNVISETPNIGTRSDLTSQDIILGGRTNATGFSMDGMIAEYLILDRSVTTQEDDLIRDYLKIKYQLPVWE